MDYINYVKEYPVQGLTGLFGGVQGSLMASSGGGGVNFGDRGIFYGGAAPAGAGNKIDYWTISTTGNASNFGTANRATSRTKGGGDLTRGLKGGGNPYASDIEYITYASTGNGTDFGNLTYDRDYVISGGNGTRQLFIGGANPSEVNTIDYLTVQTTGNATDFGDDSLHIRSAGGAGNSTRVLRLGGYGGPGSSAADKDTITYFTAMSPSNATNFGSLTGQASYTGSSYNESRAMRHGGYAPSRTNIIDYVDIMTTGNATDQGDLLHAWRYSSGCSNGPRAVNIGGDTGQGGSYYYSDVIQYWSMDATGNAQDFGNLATGRNGGAGMSGNAS